MTNQNKENEDIDAAVAQLVEHVLGKDEVTGSIPVVSPVSGNARGVSENSVA